MRRDNNLNSSCGMGAMRRDNSNNSHSISLRKHRVSLPFHIYHIVKCLHQDLCHQVDLTQPELAKIIIDAIIHQRVKNGCRLFAFAIMQDHLHWLFALPESGSLSERTKVIFNWCSVQINRQLGRKGKLWQDGYYDHLVREKETLTGLIQYIEANPVRKNLCSSPEEWPYSSAHAKWHDCLDRSWLSHRRFD